MKIKPFLVSTRIPERIKHLRELAMNMWFSWNYEALQIFIRLGYKPSQDRRFDYWEESYQNPLKMLGLLPQAELLEASRDDSFTANLERVYELFKDYLNQKTWFAKKYSKEKKFLVAYFSAEYGLDECLPVYSGGLGILSGDHLKSSSDLGIPLVGIGLLYTEGYFQQYLNNDGWQQERYPTNDWYNNPVHLETEKDGTPILISIPLEDDTIHCRIWRVQVGRIPLYLLDTNIPENSADHRQITNRLYGGDRDMRIRQEIVLGIGGVKALHALGFEPTVYHMNEGHSAFLAIERIRHLMETKGLSYREAWEIVWASNIFTTHTPVPAGNEHFSLELIRKYFTQISKTIGLGIEKFISLGQVDSSSASSFCLTVLALNTAAFCNGVSKLHGEVSRKMWHSLWPDLPREDIPITSITNGIHTFSWLSQGMRELFERYIGPKFRSEMENTAIWERIDAIPDNELWRVHQIRRERLIAFTRKRLAMQLSNRGAGPAEIRLASEILNPHTLTIGFSRRFASYKRATLLFHDLDRLSRILNDSMRPVQIIFAGKAHPMDNPGKELIRTIIETANKPEFRNSVAFIENYDINVARYLVQGVDIWLNTPRRPLEASGTSGMKAAINGVLNVSILDGWWCEGYGERNGWAIGSGETYSDAKLQDDIESEALYRLLENDIIPLYYERDRAGLPRDWIQMMKASMKNLGCYFNTHRMLIDYTERFYLNASHQFEIFNKNNSKSARELAAWRDRIRQQWDNVEIWGSHLLADDTLKVGDKASIEVNVALGELDPDEVEVEVYFGVLDVHDEISNGEIAALTAQSKKNNGYVYTGEISLRQNGRLGYAIRVLPKHIHLAHPFTPHLVQWE